jgi:Na+-driven multidrug efflux pump
MLPGLPAGLLSDPRRGRYRDFFQAIGKPVPATLLSLSRQIIFLIPAMLILGYFMGVEGVLWAGPFSDGLSGVISLITIWLSWKKIFNREVAEK